MSITIKPIEGIKVSRPYFVSKKQAIKFLLEKEEWISKHIHTIKQIEDSYTQFNEQTEFYTVNRKLSVLKWSKTSFRVNVTPNELIVKYPDSYSVTDEEVQKRIRKALEQTWKLEAEEILIPRLLNFAKHYNFQVSSVTIKNVKSKWGSCSFKNDIILSLHLMRLPQHLQDYVILHELAHTIEKNHQKPFWNLLDTITNNQAKILDKQVKKYSTKIY